MKRIKQLQAAREKNGGGSGQKRPSSAEADARKKKKRTSSESRPDKPQSSAFANTHLRSAELEAPLQVPSRVAQQV